jgi:5,10-methylenetetrahydromethanopterin reductase
MEFGIALPTPADAWRTVARAEELGFASAWFYDTQLLSADIFVGMAAAAVKTRRIRLSTGVIIPSNRIAPVTANALASLNQLAPGRIDFGVGTGYTGRRTMGLPAMRLGDMATYIRQVYGLLAEETVTCTFEDHERKVRFLQPERGLINTRDPIPLYISAFGPRARRLTAKLGGGWINFFRTDEQVRADMADWRAACAEAGHAAGNSAGSGNDTIAGTPDATLFALGCVLAPGEDAASPRAKAQAGPIVASALHRIVEDGLPLAQVPDDMRESARALAEHYRGYEPPDARYLSLHRGHLTFLRPEEEPLMTAEMLSRRTLTATPDALRDKIRGLAEAGYDRLVVQIVPGQETALEQWAEVFGGV